ncbi:MAG TPA: phosphotransferase [Streptosporangiaceae bacterium]
MTGSEAQSRPEVMAHGYTHLTTRLGSVVTKAYRGPDAAARCGRETAALAALAGQLPVPPVIAAGRDSLQTRLLPGVHGQDLIAAGLAGPVLAACGDMLRRIHALPIPAAIAGLVDSPASHRPAGASPSGTAPAGTAPAGTASASTAPGRAILVHGDYGPNNVLLDASATQVTAVVDWEWVHVGDSLEDLAWCEFIIRMHHPAEVAELARFYDAYGARPAWPDVHQMIMDRTRWMLQLCERWQPGGEQAAAWQQRLEIVARWDT